MIKLTDICTPKQWKTLSSSDLLKSGYPVYGANGIIGYWNVYNHKDPTVLITCRGAACGSVNLSKPFSYINGNAMCLDNVSDNYDVKFLFHYLSWYDFSNIITGSAQPQITRQSLSKVYIPLIDKKKQQDIVHDLTVIERALINRQQALSILNHLVKSRFIEMFGSPITNDKNLPIASLGSCLQGIENGKSFVCDSNSRTGKQPGVLKLSAATYGIYKPEENKAILSEDDFWEQAEVHAGDLLFTRKNTPELVGMSAYVWQTPEKLMMPDLIFRLIPNQQMHPIFLWKLINHDVFRCKIQELATGTAKSMSNISKERLRNLEIIVPPIKLQNQFADFVALANKSKFAVQQSIDTLQTLKAKLMQDYFG